SLYTAKLEGESQALLIWKINVGFSPGVGSDRQITTMGEDEQLLRRYAEEGSEPAFGELVRRHVDLVYSAALRMLNGDSHMAQDVTQNVFADLARKARRLPQGVLLAGWLY